MENRIFKRKKTLTGFMSQVAEFYFLAKSKVNAVSLSDISPQQNDYLKYINRVEKAFNQLTDIEKEFINKDFFFEAYPNWWRKYYSRTTYYRIRKRSILSFKEAFNNEY